MASLYAILQQAGFRGEGLRMAYAIAMAESGGNAAAHNGNAATGDNSYGLFQINMLGAMGPERRKQYGLSSNDSLFDALTNAKVAYRMSNGGTNWSPWSTYKSGAYRQYYGTAGPSGGGADVTFSQPSGGSGGGGGTGATVAKIDARTMAQMYGMDYGELQAIPELKKLFNKAVAGQWSADRFTASLKNTNWWKTTSQTQRQYFDLRYSDPATFKSKWDQTAFEANQLAVQAGRGNLLGSGTTMGHMNALLQSATYKILALGWSTDRVKDWLGAGAGMTKDGAMFGDAGDALDKLHTLTWTNGLKYSNSWYKTRAQAVAGGKSTMQYYEEAIRHTAAAKYSAFSQQILAGQNVMDLASPYIQSVQQLMETPGVDVFNKYVSKAMTTKQKDGSPYALWQLEDDVRADPLWRKTKNAQDGVMAVAHQVLQNFGFAF